VKTVLGEIPEAVLLEENGVAFETTLLAGQKTGQAGQVRGNHSRFTGRRRHQISALCSFQLERAALQILLLASPTLRPQSANHRAGPSRPRPSSASGDCRDGLSQDSVYTLTT
jgi:hypothetical protein